MYSIPLTLIILVVAFGALVAAGIPLLLALTAVFATFGLVALPSHLLPIAPEALAVVLLVGLAVGVDYSMFYLRRVREERAAGRSERAALEAAAATSGRSVLISGLTVMVAMAGLFFAGDSTFASFGYATMIVVALAMVGSLTVLPALLSKLGDGVDRLHVPLVGRLRSDDGEGRVWGAIVDRVLRRPLLSAVIAGGLLLALAAPALQLRMATPGPDTFPKSLDVVKTYNRMQHAFPGTALPAYVVVKAADVNAPAVRQAIGRLKLAALATGRARGPITTATNKDGTIANITVPILGKGTDAQSNASLAALREDVLPKTVGALPNVQAGVTGLTAEWKDAKDQLRSKLPLVVGFVLLFAFALMLVAFRSIVVAIKAIVLNLLSVAAAYGVLVLVFQHGIGKGLLGFSSTAGIDPVTPLLLFVILFGLSMDYHVFIISRIRETFDRGASMDDAIAHGIKSTAGVVTSAAIVMVAVFSIFATLSMLIFKQFGVGLAAAILIDATLVRGVLLPATMKLLGERNWYLPRWLEWLPRLDKPEPSRGRARAGRGARLRIDHAVGSPASTAGGPNRQTMKGVEMQADAHPQKRTGLTIGAWVAAVLGVLVLAAGVTGIWASSSKRDHNGYFSANAHRYQTHTRAIATESITVGSYVPTWLAGKVRLDVSGDKPLFVGIAPKATVDAYLARIAHTEATKLDLDPFKVTYVDHPGTVDPGRPASEPFWAAAVSGTSRPLTWKLRSGDWSIVVMNADGSRDVAATIGVGVKVPALLWVGIGLSLLGGALLVLAGLMFAARSRSYRRAGCDGQPWPGERRSLPAPPPSGRRCSRAPARRGAGFGSRGRRRRG